eukprot:1160184-Pelagomonas_calceolata.AAC.1
MCGRIPGTQSLGAAKGKPVHECLDVFQEHRASGLQRAYTCMNSSSMILSGRLPRHSLPRHRH